MTLHTRSYQSVDLSGDVARHRFDHKELFALVDAMGMTAIVLINTMRDQREGDDAAAQLLCLLLLLRALSNFEGAVLMAERGLIVEARTLTRACFETAACLSAICHAGEAAILKLLSAREAATKAMIDELLKPNLATRLKPEVKKGLAAKREELMRKKPMKYSIYDMAKDGDLLSSYVDYRELSGDAAHPGAEALERYIEWSEEDGLRDLRIGPQAGKREIEDTLEKLCLFFLTALSAAHDMFGSKDAAKRIVAHVAVFAKLKGVLGSLTR